MRTWKAAAPPAPRSWCREDRGQLAPPSGDVKPWGRWSTFGLGLIALLVGQMAALVALTWWFGAYAGASAEFLRRRRGGEPGHPGIDAGAGGAADADGAADRRYGCALSRLRAAAPRRRHLGHHRGHRLHRRRRRHQLHLRPNIVTPSRRDIYRTAAAAGWLPMLWLVVVVVTPIGEETLFRGFLFRGWLAIAARCLGGDRGQRCDVCRRARAI